MAVVFDTPKITGAVDPPRYTRYLVGKAALNAATVSAVVTPLGYALYAVRGGFALRSALRASWLGPLVGGAVGAGLCGMQLTRQSPLDTFQLAERVRADAKRIRTEDSFLFGACIGAAALSLSMRRAGALNGIFGGASLGGAAGVLLDTYRRYEEIDKAGQPVSVFAPTSPSTVVPAAALS